MLDGHRSSVSRTAISFSTSVSVGGGHRRSVGSRVAHTCGVTRGVLVSARKTTYCAVVAFALAMAWPLATVDAATTRASAVPAKLLGVWHKKMTDADCVHVRGQEERHRHHLRS